MAELIEMKAPAIIIYHEARLIQEAYRPNWFERFTWWLQTTRVGMWYTMLGYEEPEGLDEAMAECGLDEAGFLRLAAEVAKPHKEVASYDAESHSCTLCHCLWGVYNEGCPCDCHN